MHTIFAFALLSFPAILSVLAVHWKIVTLLFSVFTFGTVAQGKFTGFQPQGFWPTQLGVAFNRNAFLKAWQPGAVTYTASACSADTISEQSVTVTGLTTSDVVLVQLQGTPTANVGCLTSRVSAANTLALRFINPTSGSLTPPASGSYLFFAVQVQ